MLFKELLKVLVKIDSYSIRIDTYDFNTMTTKKSNIYKMNEIPTEYYDLEVATIHSTEAYDGNFQYFITIYNK